MSQKKLKVYRNPGLLEQQIQRIKQDNNQLNAKVKLLKQQLLEALKSKQKYKAKYKSLKQKLETLHLIQHRVNQRLLSRDHSSVQHSNLISQKQKSEDNPYQVHQQKQYKLFKEGKLIKSQSNLQTQMTNSLHDQKEYIKICKQVSSVNAKIQKIQTMLNERLEKEQQRAKQDRKQMYDLNDKVKEQFTKQISEIKKLLEGLQITKETLHDHSIVLQSQSNNIILKSGSANNLKTYQTLNDAKDKSKIMYKTPKNVRSEKKDITSQKKMLMNLGKQLLNFRFNTDSQNQAH